MELSKYQTLPGKLSKKKAPKDELNGHRGRDTEYLSPVHLSPANSHSKDYTLSEFFFFYHFCYKVIFSANEMDGFMVVLYKTDKTLWSHVF